ncbi:ArsR/SmtB family transcription factor [Halostella litorea]|uniref:ArsR/SmtB family transcription factor n=1 Tax=Halostella litorea TaxID=2528831 RepID=UPI001092A573|nr:winged helix-turn-helix domain-containing protein [Halostella litorea]
MTMQPPSSEQSERTTETTGRSDATSGSDESTVDPATVLELIGDANTRAVLGAVAGQPRSAREIAEATDVSRVTAYRRLDRLEALGLVDSTTAFDENGHHHEQYRATCERVVVRLDADGLGVSVRTSPEGDEPGE